ncbi:hypothetical protein [Candidatus Albibeggiatoa sp. nov. NOAA]|uniref:hypothetical protein n=1 Tax=Candidatus Albibeggiatoa sp. nov. NOAA TaxID=3162724 RepID=UPI00330151A3|nr:hypothetical protein [Thiotrichaceae bacterium]
MSIKATAAIAVTVIFCIAGALAYFTLGLPNDSFSLLQKIASQSPQIILILLALAFFAVLIMFFAFISLFQIESKTKAGYPVA